MFLVPIKRRVIGPLYFIRHTKVRICCTSCKFFVVFCNNYRNGRLGTFRTLKSYETYKTYGAYKPYKPFRPLDKKTAEVEVKKSKKTQITG